MKPILPAVAAVLACDGQRPTQDEASLDELQRGVIHSHWDTGPFKPEACVPGLLKLFHGFNGTELARAEGLQLNLLAILLETFDEDRLL